VRAKISRRVVRCRMGGCNEQTCPGMGAHAAPSALPAIGAALMNTAIPVALDDGCVEGPGARRPPDPGRRRLRITARR
jgi:hypothetical protein